MSSKYILVPEIGDILYGVVDYSRTLPEGIYVPIYYLLYGDFITDTVRRCPLEYVRWNETLSNGFVELLREVLEILKRGDIADLDAKTRTLVLRPYIRSKTTFCSFHDRLLQRVRDRLDREGILLVYGSSPSVDVEFKEFNRESSILLPKLFYHRERGLDDHVLKCLSEACQKGIVHRDGSVCIW